MPLHHSKKIALLNSLNCISSNDLTSLKDLSDGRIFSNILSTTFNESSDYVEKCENDTSVSESDNIISEESKSVDIAVTESENVTLSENSPESENVDTKGCSPESTVESVQIESSNDVDKLILHRFKSIQNFIDRRYNLKSDEIISYTKCIKGSEFELAKVAVFILSEVVSHFVLINNDHLSTLAHLDVRMQEDLEECFSLFISQRDRISKKDVEKLLSNHAKYKSRSPKSSFATPRRNCASKYKVVIPTTPTNEEIFSDSPLKSFFDSPVFKKEDMLQKEKELAKTRNDLLKEELKADELQLELKDVKKTLQLKEKEIASLKTTMEMLKSDKHSQDLEEELKKLQEKYDSLKKESDHKAKEYENEINYLLKEKNFLEFEAKTNKGFSRYFNVDEEDLVNELIVKDTLLGKKNDMMASYRLKQCELYKNCSKLESSLVLTSNKLAAEKQKREDLEVQVAKQREFYAAKLSELKAAVKNEPQSPGSGENLGVIIEEENRLLQQKLDDANLKIKQLEEELKLAIQPEEKIPESKNAFNTSIVDGLDLANSGRNSMSAFDAIDLLEMCKDVKKQSQKCEELNDSLAECDMLNNSEIAFKDSSSVHSDAGPSNNNASEYAVLWKNCSMEIDESSTTSTQESSNKQPVNCDKFPDLCSNCNCNIKENGCNFSSGFVQIIEKKNEEINDLKAKYEVLERQAVYLQNRCDTMEEQIQMYSEKLDERNETIKALKLELGEANRSYKEYHSKYEICRTRLISVEVKYAKFKEMDGNYKRREDQMKKKIDNIKCQLKKKDLEFLLMEKEMLRKCHTIKQLEQKITALEEEKQSLQNKLKEKEQQSEKMNEINPFETQKKNLNQKSESFFINFNVDSSNETTESGALFNGIAAGSCVTEDEDSIAIEKDVSCFTDLERKRAEEIMRRNSILPEHLQSSYPIEINLNCSSEKLYMRPSVRQNQNHGHLNKKRKIDEEESLLKYIEFPNTPIAKLRRTLNPSSLKKLLSFDRRHRKGPIMPKP